MESSRRRRSREAAAPHRRASTLAGGEYESFEASLLEAARKSTYARTNWDGDLQMRPTSSRELVSTSHSHSRASAAARATASSRTPSQDSSRPWLKDTDRPAGMLHSLYGPTSREQLTLRTLHHKAEATAAKIDAARDAVLREEDERIGLEEGFIARRRLQRNAQRAEFQRERAISHLVSLQPSALHAIRDAAYLQRKSPRDFQKHIYRNWVVEKKARPTPWGEASKGDLAGLQAVLEDKRAPQPVDAVDLASRETALFVAIRHRNMPMVKYLFSHGASASHRDKMDSTPLHVAAAYADDPEIFSDLVARGADINAKDLFGATPLMNAVQSMQVLAVRELLRLGASPLLRNTTGHTAFQIVEEIASKLVADELVAKVTQIKDLLREAIAAAKTQFAKLHARQVRM